MKMLTAAEYAQKMDPPVSERRVRQMCERGRIRGAKKVGRTWVIPENAVAKRELKHRVK